MKFERFDRFFPNSIPNVFENSFYNELFNSILKKLRQLERLQTKINENDIKGRGALL